MKINPFSRLLLFSLLLIVAGSSAGHCQIDKQIDSLKTELLHFDARKIQLGEEVTQKMDTSKVILYSKLSQLYYLANPGKAKEYAEMQLYLSQKINYPWGIANAYKVLGAIYDLQSKYGVALQNYKKSLKISIAAKDTLGQIDLYVNIGSLYSKLSNNPEGLKYMLKGLTLAKKINDHYGIGGIYNNIGVINDNQKNYPEALKNYLIALKIYLKIKEYTAACVIYQNIGQIYLQENKLNDAMYYLEKGLSLSLLGKNKESTANSYNTIAKVLLAKKEYDKALQNSLTALQIRKDIDDGDGVPSSYIDIGNIYFKQGDHAKAIENIEMGVASLKQSGEIDLLSVGYNYLSEIYAATGNYKKAYENHLLYKQANDHIFNTEKEQKFTEQQLKYEFKSIQDATKLAQEKKDFIAKKELENQRNLKDYTFLGTAIIVCFLIILLLQRNKIAKIRRQKALETERNRISRDLHDNLGAQLSTVRMFVSSLKDDKANNYVSEIVDNSIELLDDSISELRKIMNEMHHSALLENGYLAATEELINKINQLHLIVFALTHHKMEERLPPNIEHNLYRITQELINNTLKYANAKNVSIDVLKRDGVLVFMYEDDGTGYDLQSVKKGNGHENIQTRTSTIGGKVEFDTAPGAGARTIIEIPL